MKLTIAALVLTMHGLCIFWSNVSPYPNLRGSGIQTSLKIKENSTGVAYNVVYLSKGTYFICLVSRWFIFRYLVSSNFFSRTPGVHGNLFWRPGVYRNFFWRLGVHSTPYKPPILIATGLQQISYKKWKKRGNVHSKTFDFRLSGFDGNLVDFYVKLQTGVHIQHFSGRDISSINLQRWIEYKGNFLSTQAGSWCRRGR